MNFKDVQRVPAVVVVATDPQKKMRIKVNAPGLFDSTLMDDKTLPWVYPYNGNTLFSSPKKGDKVWLYNNTKNYNEFWYEPMFVPNDSVQEMCESDEDTEVLMARECNGKTVAIYYNSIDGITIKNGDDCLINLGMDDSVSIQSKDTNVNIENGEVHIGDSTDEYQPTIMGTEMQTLLSTLSDGFNSLVKACEMDGHLLPLRQVFESMKTSINDSINDIVTKNTQVN